MTRAYCSDECRQRTRMRVESARAIAIARKLDPRTYRESKARTIGAALREINATRYFRKLNFRDCVLPLRQMRLRCAAEGVCISMRCSRKVER